jgi:RNA polymerase sigma-70 factor (ECF subfamily)
MSGETSEGTDDALLEATATGDEDAFVEIYRRHRRRVFGFAYRMTGSPEIAEDVTHACFTALLEAPRRYRGGDASLGSYLCAAARNQILKRLRRTQREVGGTALDERRADSGPGPLHGLLADERARVVREAVLALRPLHREVVILVEYEELDLATVATIVGAEVGAVKVRLHRARQKLRQALEGYVQPPRTGIAAEAVRK